MLVLLALRNIWVVLIQQKKYRNLPILAFYSFTIIAVTLRPTYMIGIWSQESSEVYLNMDFVQQGAKFCVGVVQDWITLELAIRIHNARGSSDISTAAKRKLRSIFRIIFIGLTLFFTVWSITILESARKPGNEKEAFYNTACLVLNIIAYTFLIQVVIMLLLVAWLFIETYRVVARERQARQGGFVTHTLHKERCTYTIVSVFFALSYIGRYINNRYAACEAAELSYFASHMTEDACILSEGVSMGVLMYFHFANFREGGLFSSDKADELAYISIMPNEYHRFDTESVEDHSLADPSSLDIGDDSEQAGSEQASMDFETDNQPFISGPVLNQSTKRHESETSTCELNE